MVNEKGDRSQVHAYPDIFESETFSFRMRLPSTCIRRIRQRIRIFLNPALQSGKNKSSTNPITCGGVNLDIFESDDVEDSCPNSYRTKHQNGGATATTEQIWRYYRGLYGACSEHILLQRSPGHLSESGYHRMRYRETKPTCCAPSDAILVYFLLKDWTRFCTSSDSKISGFTRPHVVGFVADSFFFALWRADSVKSTRIRCRIRRSKAHPWKVS